MTSLFANDSSGATFSACRQYRYVLWRAWGATDRTVAFIGLNPSTADETENDPTIRRCIGFAKSWGFDRLVMLNLFAFRATDPSDMKRAADAVGPDNDATLVTQCASAGRIVGCWGAHGAFNGRYVDVRRLIPQRIECFGTTKSGQPKHPLYLPSNSKLEVYWEGIQP